MPTRVRQTCPCNHCNINRDITDFFCIINVNFVPQTQQQCQMQICISNENMQTCSYIAMTKSAQFSCKTFFYKNYNHVLHYSRARCMRMCHAMRKCLLHHAACQCLLHHAACPCLLYHAMLFMPCHMPAPTVPRHCCPMNRVKETVKCNSCIFYRMQQSHFFCAGYSMTKIGIGPKIGTLILNIHA